MSSIEQRRPLGMDPIPLAFAKSQALYQQFLDVASRACVPSLRIALGAVYIWFGMLKVLGDSPVALLVRDTVPFVHPGAWFVTIVGAFEVGLGAWMLIGRRLQLMLLLFIGHMIGTFGVYVIQPGMAFQHDNPLLLTSTGEFVLKNLVLLAAGITIVAVTDPKPK